MQQELIQYFQDRNAGPGLLLAEAPTGYGKTYQAIQAIYTYVKQGGKCRVLFVTELMKNLPTDELQRAYDRDGRSGQFQKDVLVLRSAADTVMEAIGKQNVPEEFQTKTFCALEDACRKYEHYRGMKGEANAELAKIWNDSIREKLEPDFRRELETSLRRKIPDGAARRRQAIRTQKKYQWIAAFYPAVFWQDYKVLFLTVKKLMARNISIVEPAFECLSDRMLKDAIVCIDEFDASRRVILDSLIEKSLTMQADYLQLFVQVYKGIRIHQSSRELTALRERFEAGRNVTWQDLLDQAEAIYQDGALYYSMKTVGEGQDKGRNFLFHDTSYHTVLDHNRTHIRAERSDQQAQVQIYFDTPDTYRAGRDKPRIVLQNLLRRIHVFLLRFQRYVYGWAEEYARQVNDGRNREEDFYPVAAAAQSIFREYGLTREQVYLMTVGLQEETGAAHHIAAPDLSFYETGFRLFEFIDDDCHRTQTRLQYLQLQNTPEKVLLYLCHRAKVVGLSATACLPTVLGNYDLRYLREQLGERYVTLSRLTREAVREEMEELWAPYRVGEIQVSLQVVDRVNRPLAQRLEEIFEEKNRARQYERRLSCLGVNEYEGIRYCNLFTAIKAFWQHDDIQAFLVLNQLLPAAEKPALDENLLREGMEELGQLVAPEQKARLVVLRSGERFEADKADLMQKLGAGERCVIFSSYQTLGAGQNLQYPVQDKNGLIVLGKQDNAAGDSRLSNKDVDAMYLGDITHVTVNLWEADGWQKSDLMRYCFQAECLYQNDEISFQTMQALLKAGLGRYSGKAKMDGKIQAKLQKCPSFSGRVTRDVVQAVGRMGRTFLKKPTVYLFTTTQVLQHLDAEYMSARLLSPEMQALAEGCRDLQAAGRQGEKECYEAERIATRGNAYLMQMLHTAWTDKSMSLWKELRHTVLRYPRAEEALRRENPVIRTYYLPMKPQQSKYFYAQKGDFSEVHLAAEENKAALKAGLSGDFFFAEVSAEEAGLPALMKNSALRQHFEAQGWATDFGNGPYVLSPVLFNNVYKGALGEAAGAWILEKELGLTMQEIEDPSCFEFFDFMGPTGLWFDFKHWKSSTHQEQDTLRSKTLAKLDAVGGRRAFLINLMAEPEFQPSCTADDRLVEVPGLLLPDGRVNRQALMYVARFLE